MPRPVLPLLFASLLAALALGFLVFYPNPGDSPSIVSSPTTSQASPPDKVSSYAPRDLAAACPANDPSAASCVSRLLAEVAEESSWSSALALLDEVMRADPGLYAKCHTIAHELGHRASSQLPLDAVIAADPGTCGDGFTHGWVSGSASQGNLDDLVAANLALCEVEDSRQNFVASQNGAFFKGSCPHGLGHAVYQTLPYDFLGGVEKCGQLRKVSEWTEGKCISGLLMAFGSKEAIISGGLPMDVEGATVADVCRTLAGEPARECWHNTQPFFRNDPQGLAETCTTVNSVDCAVGLGYLLYQESKFSPQAATSNCEPITSGSIFTACLRGVLYADWRLALQTGEDLDKWRPDCKSLISAAQDLCDSGFKAFVDEYQQGLGFSGR